MNWIRWNQRRANPWFLPTAMVDGAFLLAVGMIQVAASYRATCGDNAPQ